jgi:DNA-binding transcriptional regulator YhcF (GntR family)
MGEQELEHEKKLPRTRKLATLSSIRKEIIRVYEEARNAGADTAQIQYHRALTFILSNAADVMKNEKIDDIEARLTALEQGNTGEKENEYNEN